MRESMKEAMLETVQGLHDIGIKTSFTKKDLNNLGIKLKKVKIDNKEIQHIRESMRLSQNVFADVLNVSVSSVRKWEKGERQPSGSTKVLLEVLEKKPHLLDYRLTLNDGVKVFA